jgi:flavin reductase (DIM6/NTAB) family NADH-FMN oxidoreductase RutF
MELDFADLQPRERYKVLTGFIIPRPIAFVTTCDAQGRTNAAPFSFFNVFGDDPAVIALGFGARPEGGLKDTIRNITDTGEFVVNMVDEPLAEAMNLCATDFPEGVSELTETGLTEEPSRAVKPPRIAESPASFECRLMQNIQFNPGRILTLGEVVWMRARDSVIEAENLRTIDDAYTPVGRLYADQYARQRDRFKMKRRSYAEWRKDRDA